MVVFARQNLIADPPFSRMDLISCRNLLIYLEPSLQKKAMPTFHYALKPEGFLLLGASESIGGFTDLFEPVDKKHKIYSRKPAPTRRFICRHEGTRRARAGRRPPLPMRQPDRPEPPEAVRGELSGPARGRPHHRQPVRASRRARQCRASGPAVPRADRRVSRAARRQGELRRAEDGAGGPDAAAARAINQARKENKTARKENVRVRRNGKTRTVNLEVIPLKNLRERCFLILFEEADKAARASRAPTAKTIEPPPEAARPTAKRPTASPSSKPSSPRCANTSSPCRNSTRRPTRSSRRPTRRSSPPTKSCRASTRSWRRPRRSWSRPTKS